MKFNFRYRCICALKKLYFKPNLFIHSYCLGIDVVGYSKHPTDVQLEVVKKIQSYVEYSLSLKKVSRKHMVFLPTGDGMIVCLLGSKNMPTLIINLAIELQQRFRKENEKVDESRKIVVRMGIHSGTGASYLDINRNLNIAGHVANMTQRVMNFAIDWQILASKNAFDDIGTLDNDTRDLFHYIGFGEAKHKQAISVYNVYRIDDPAFGNSVRPPQIYSTEKTEFTGQ